MPSSAGREPGKRPAHGMVRFDRDELVRLTGLVGVVGFGLFWYYNSRPEFRGLVDGEGQLVYAGAAALAYGFGPAPRL